MATKKSQVSVRLDSRQLSIIQAYAAEYNMSQELLLRKKIDNLWLPKEKQVARIIYRVEGETTSTGWFIMPAQKVKLQGLTSFDII